MTVRVRTKKRFRSPSATISRLTGPRPWLSPLVASAAHRFSAGLISAALVLGVTISSNCSAGPPTGSVFLRIRTGIIPAPPWACMDYQCDAERPEQDERTADARRAGGRD